MHPMRMPVMPPKVHYCTCLTCCCRGVLLSGCQLVLSRVATKDALEGGGADVAGQEFEGDEAGRVGEHRRQMGSCRRA